MQDFKAKSFLALTSAERARKCRELALEAERLAAAAGPQWRDSYLTIARQWMDLADDMECAFAN